MIFGLPKLYAYGAAVVVAALLAGGIYFKGRSDGKEAVETRYAAALAQAIRETAEKDAELRKLTEEVENDLRPRLEAATDRGNSLADSLRRYQARRCPLSDPPRPPTEPSDGPGVAGDIGPPTEIDRALEAHLGACERDAERLGAFQRWYGDLQRSFAAQ